MLTLKPESKPGSDAPIAMLNIIPIIMNIIPKYKQFFAFDGLSDLKTKNAIIPPIIPKNIGNKNHALLLCFSGYDMSFTLILQL